MLHRSTSGTILLWTLLLVFSIRPALACLSVPSFVPQMTHECCQHSCQHEHRVRDIEHCCLQQHGATLQGDIPLLTRAEQPNQLIAGQLVSNPSNQTSG